MMRTFQGMRMRTDWMMEQLRRQAIDETWKKWEAAAFNYYRQGYDNGESVKLIKELERLGANSEAIIDRDLEIRDEVELEKELKAYMA